MYQWKRTLQASALALGLCSPLLGHAADIIYQSVGFIDGTDAKKTSFNVTSAGWYSMRVVDFEYGEEFQQLEFSVENDDKSFGSVSRNKSEMRVKIDAPGQYYAVVMGQAGDLYDLGMYGVSIQLSEQAPIEPTPSAVPLPASFWLLGSAVAAWLGLFSRRKRRGT
jgi:hypothetical protein